jgi:hypothetical protein
MQLLGSGATRKLIESDGRATGEGLSGGEGGL